MAESFPAMMPQKKLHTRLSAFGNLSMLQLLQEQQALHYELNKNISLQRRITLSQADEIQACRDTIADMEKQLAEAHGRFPRKLAIVPNF
jgi:hypothetical protein